MDSLLPAEAGEGERATLGRTLLAALLLAQGVPTLAADAVADAAAARFVRLLLRLRRRCGQSTNVWSVMMICQESELASP